MPMDKVYFEDKIFDGSEQEISSLTAGDYEHCLSLPRLNRRLSSVTLILWIE